MGTTGKILLGLLGLVVVLGLIGNTGSQKTTTTNNEDTTSNHPPNAEIDVNRYGTGEYGAAKLLKCGFYAGDTTDPDGENDLNAYTSYTWDYGDGSTGKGVTLADHTYDTSGRYTVVLTVEDKHGASDTAKKTIKVPPVIHYKTTAKDLAREFAKNEVGANSKYDYKVVNVKGEVADFNLVNEVPTVVLKGSNGIDIRCQFPPSRQSQVGNLNRGEIVRIVGRYDGISIGSISFEYSFVEQSY